MDSLAYSACGSKSTGCAYPAHIPRISFGIVCGPLPKIQGVHPYRCGPRVIRNALNSMLSHGLGCALGSAGGSRIIGNALNSIHFHCLGCASGHWKCIEFFTFPMILGPPTHPRAQPKSLEMYKIQCISNESGAIPDPKTELG